MNFALDTNIIIRYLRNDIIVSYNVDFALKHKFQIYIPRIVDYEIRRGFSVLAVPAKKKETAYKILIERCPVAAMCDASWAKALLVYRQLYQKGFTVGEMDMLIAAFCLEYGFILVTNNTADFANVEGLELADWTYEQDQFKL